MGLVQSCLGKKNKVGIMEEEVEAYKKIKRETEHETQEDTQKEPLHKVVFGSMKMDEEHTRIDDTTNETTAAADVVKAKGGVSFNVEFHSSVPKLPPIFMKTNSRVVRNHEPEKWKEEQEMLIIEKQERAQVRRNEAREKKILAAQRPKAAKFHRTIHVAFSDNPY